MVSVPDQRSTPLPSLSTQTSLRGFRAFVICNSILLNSTLAAISVFLLSRGLLLRSNVSSALSAAAMYFFRGHQGHDSWSPMLEALKGFFAGQPIYQTIFFVKKVKFQYPLPSLIPFYLMKRFGVSDDAIFSVMNLFSWCAICVTVAVSFALLRRCLTDRGLLLTRKHTLELGALTVVAGLFFYPLIKGYSVGQIQCAIDALFALALYSWISGRQAAAGFLIGLMCLIKPQYSIILLWFGLRKRSDAFLASLSVVVIGFLAAVVIFGWREQLDYLSVLSFMGKHGESYFANQSVNGLIHRLLFEGSNLTWEPNAFAPYSRFAYAATVVSTVLFLAAALFHPKFQQDRNGLKDFALVSLAATVASPIVWEHHYGIVFPIAAWLAGSLTSKNDLRWFATSFVLLGTSWSALNVFAKVPILNMLQSLPFLGALLLFLFFFRNGPRELPVLEVVREGIPLSRAHYETYRNTWIHSDWTRHRQ